MHTRGANGLQQTVMYGASLNHYSTRLHIYAIPTHRAVKMRERLAASF